MGELFHRVIVKLFGDGKNWALFLFSLIVAFLLWGVRNVSRPYTDFATVSVQAECNLDGYASESVNVADLTVRCKATEYDFMLWRTKLKRDESIKLSFDRKDLFHAGGEYFYVTAENLENYSYVLFGESTEIENFVTDTLFFRFPFENNRKVPVSLVKDIYFTPQYGYIGDIHLQPDSVYVYGSPSLLQSIDCVETLPLRLYDQHKSKAGIIGLKSSPSVRISETSVRYSINVGRYVEHTMTLPVELRNVPANKKLFVLPASVTLTCRCTFPTAAETLDEIAVYVDYNDFVKSRNGSCIPYLENVPGTVIKVSVTPEALECVLAGVK